MTKRMLTNKNSKKSVPDAIKAWTKLLGVKRVSTALKELAMAQTATFNTRQKIMAVLYPRSAEQIQGIMLVANRFKVAVFPISGGKNWGLGSKVPQTDGVIIDLSKMNKILAYNQDLAYLTVEPGVTFKQAEDFLRQKGAHLVLDTIGSTPDASIVGNTAERGHGMALYADRFNHVCGLEIVLPNGKIIETGFEGWKNSKLGALAKWGTGPYLDGLFTQSNLGVISKLTIWLKPAPKHFQSFIFHVDKPEKLAALMDAWRKARLEGLSYSLRIFNDIRMIAFSGRFPEGEPVPISETALAKLRAERNIGQWIGLGATYAPTKAHAQADRLMVLELCKPFVDNIEFFDETSVQKLWQNASEQERAKLNFMFNKSLLRGFTSPAGINMVYWRKPAHVVVNEIHRDGCGVLWYCPAIPFRGPDVLKAISIAQSVCRKFKFELNIGFLFISERVLDITGAICYDRHIKGEDARAKKCHDQIMDEMQKEGFTAYRLGIPSMQLLKNRSKNVTQLLQSLKRVVDKNQILAPGRYIA